MEKWREIVDWALETACSEIHLVGGHPAVCRKDGLIGFDDAQTPTHQDVEGLANDLLTEREVEEFRLRQSVVIARSIRRVRVRALVTTTARGLSLSIRLLPGRPPDLAGLNLHPSLAEIAELAGGLVLICGPVGSGRTTTLVSILEEINRNRPVHIVTLENPVEYRLASKRAFIQQREKLTHFPSFEQGLADALREGPEVIGIDKFDGPEMTRLALHAAEAGRLVIAVLDAASAEEALLRLQTPFAPELRRLIRGLTASTLRFLVVQKLRPFPPAGFDVPFLNIYRNSPDISAAILESQLSRLDRIAESSPDGGMFTDKTYAAYLASCRYFIPPADQFRPSEETAANEFYRPPGIPSPDIPTYAPDSGNGVHRPAIPHAELANLANRSESDARHDETDAGYYVIDGKMTRKSVLNIFSHPSNMAPVTDNSGRNQTGFLSRESEDKMNQVSEIIHGKAEMKPEPPPVEKVARIHETPEALDRLLRYAATLAQLKKKA